MICDNCKRESTRYVCEQCMEYSKDIRKRVFMYNAYNNKEAMLDGLYITLDDLNEIDEKIASYKNSIKPFIKQYELRMKRETAAKYRSNNKDKIKARNAQYYFMKKIGLIVK